MDRLQSKINRLNDQDTGFTAVTAVELENSGLKDITLRPYQLDGVNWLIERYHRNHGCILGDEMGLGKTCQTIAFLTYLHGSLDVSGPFLILCPLSVLRNWQEELKRFSPGLEVVVYVGHKEKREEVRHSLRRHRNFHVMLSTYEICLKDESFLRRFEWQALVVDEAHRLKNQNSLLHQTLKEFTIHYHLLLTGTPVQNNMEELFSLLHFVAPSVFKQHYGEDFVDRYSAVDNDSSSVRQELHTLLQPFLLRRVKSEVIKDLPKKSEVVLYHGLTSLQKKYYKAILMKDLDAFQTVGPGPSKTRLMNILMQLRKCVNHPYLFDGVEPEPFVLGEHLIEASGKLFLLDQLLSYLKKKNHKVLVFSQMTRVLDILQDYLGFRGYSYERLDGSVRGEERYLAIQNFNQQDDVFVFLLSTRAGGQGLNLASADTVIFMDSDFNPQNDLQAAARAHRIGQTRPVKIIRLIGGSTVEEIILKRAEAKLKLTNSVIEGGQLSGLNSIADSGAQLSDILKFGLDKLFESDESLESLSNADLEAMLGASHRGNWVEEVTSASQDQDQEEEGDVEEEETANNMYVFEGKDYSKEPSADDIKAFETLIAVEASIEEDTLSDERRLRKKKAPLVSLADLPTRKRKQLTPEELEERKKKRQEAAAKRAKLKEEEEVRRAQKQKERREAKWKSHGYNTCNIAMETDEEESDEEVTMVTDDDDEEEDVDRRAINYVMGDVTHPQCTGDQDAIIVHCVDDSGSWGQGGLFSALSARSSQPEMQYQLAGKMKDLALGDAHLIAVDDRESRTKGSDMVALIVAQDRDRNNRLSGIKLSALNQGLVRICTAARRMKASVHLPRIGYNTPGFNWYGTERLIRKHLSSRGIPTYIYYYPRKNKKQAVAKTTGASASTSQQTTSTPVSQTTAGNSLPDFMQGVVVFLHDVTDEQRKKYTRYLVAYDGDICEYPTEETTHVVVGSCSSDDQVLQQVAADCTEAAVVSTRWLDECLSRGRKVPEDPHKIALK